MSDENITTQEPETTAAVAVTIPGLDQLKDMTKDDLLKLQQDLVNFPAAIEQAIEAKIAEEAEVIENDINQAETKVKTWTEQFREKHGVSVWVAVIGGGYIVWQVGSAVLKVLGVY